MTTDSTAEQTVSHTPGPWIVDQIHERSKRELHIDSPVAFWIAEACHGGEVVATVENVSVERGAADAHLIAAAPALFAALKAMVASYDGIRDGLTSPIVRDKLAHADAAIQKAEGRS